ncbi:MAG: hypothetical protein LC800_03705 [Acidobacteria bacterium]|nr:hypothetical protein [Acidobacteriota bacterium]
MKSRQKKFCPRCGDRVSRSANRCHNCRAFVVPSWPRVAGLAGLAFLLLAAMVLAGRLLS